MRNEAWKEIFFNRKIALPLIILAGFYTVAANASFFAPYDYKQDDALYVNAPPSKLHIADLDQCYFGPFIYGQNQSIDQYYHRVYTEDKSVIHPIRFFVSGYEYKLFGFLKSDLHLFGVPDVKFYFIGADNKGRDIFSRMIFGARVSLFVALAAAVLTLFIGLIVGGISGYFGGLTDNILMRFCEMMMMAPAFYLILALRASFPSSLSSTQIYILIILILSFISWASTARIIRGMAIGLAKSDFVTAARIGGLSDFKIIMRHILPHTMSYALIAVFISIPGYILGEAALSMVGLGIQEPEASWGNLLSQALGIVNIQLYPWILIPGIFLLIAVICFNALGEALRDAFDPKRRNL